MRAATRGRVDVVATLLSEPGVYVNMKNTQNVTALIFAACDGHTAVVAALLNTVGVQPLASRARPP